MYTRLAIAFNESVVSLSNRAAIPGLARLLLRRAANSLSFQPSLLYSKSLKPWPEKDHQFWGPFSSRLCSRSPPSSKKNNP
jgi:hypothetical protein